MFLLLTSAHRRPDSEDDAVLVKTHQRGAPCRATRAIHHLRDVDIILDLSRPQADADHNSHPSHLLRRRHQQVPGSDDQATHLIDDVSPCQPPSTAATIDATCAHPQLPPLTTAASPRWSPDAAGVERPSPVLLVHATPANHPLHIGNN
ncbi:hypothetical protein ACLOJK_039174, partial [Asimina triloba]